MEGTIEIYIHHTITTGTMFLITSSGRIIPMAEIPTPDFAVPYAAPKPADLVVE
jgi:hypothetical protein